MTTGPAATVVMSHDNPCTCKTHRGWERVGRTAHFGLFRDPNAPDRTPPGSEVVHSCIVSADSVRAEMTKTETPRRLRGNDFRCPTQPGPVVERGKPTVFRPPARRAVVFVPPPPTAK